MIKQTVLAIDDSQDIHRLLQVRLKDEDIELLHCYGPQDGIDRVREVRPDLILLDVSLPILSGFEVCAVLKADETVRDIPVIFLSGLDEVSDKAKGLEAGAIDYITKPFEGAELVARVRAALRTKAYHDEIVSQKQEILSLHAKLNDHMTMELDSAKKLIVQSEKLATLGQMMASISHEMSNPVALMTISIELIETSLEQHAAYLHALLAKSPDSEKVASRVEEQLNNLRVLVKDCLTASDRLSTIGRALTTQSRVDLDATLGVQMNSLVEESLTIVKGKLKELEVETNLESQMGILCHRSHIGQVITNLLSNAADVVRAKHQKRRDVGKAFDGKMRVDTFDRAKDGKPGIVVEISDNGDGVPEDLRERIFEEFFTTKPAGTGTGLGLALCAAIVDKHQGYIEVDDDKKLGGACFRLWLPLDMGG